MNRIRWLKKNSRMADTKYEIADTNMKWLTHISGK